MSLGPRRRYGLNVVDASIEDNRKQHHSVSRESIGFKGCPEPSGTTKTTHVIVRRTPSREALGGDRVGILARSHQIEFERTWDASSFPPQPSKDAERVFFYRRVSHRPIKTDESVAGGDHHTKSGKRKNAASRQFLGSLSREAKYENGQKVRVFLAWVVLRSRGVGIRYGFAWSPWLACSAHDANRRNILHGCCRVASIEAFRHYPDVLPRHLLNPFTSVERYGSFRDTMLGRIWRISGHGPAAIASTAAVEANAESRRQPVPAHRFKNRGRKRPAGSPQKDRRDVGQHWFPLALFPFEFLAPLRRRSTVIWAGSKKKDVVIAFLSNYRTQRRKSSGSANI